MCLHSFPGVWIQWRKHCVLFRLWGLQEHKVSCQATSQSPEDLWWIHRLWCPSGGETPKSSQSESEKFQLPSQCMCKAPNSSSSHLNLCFCLFDSLSRLTSTMKPVTSPKPTCRRCRPLALTWRSTRSTCSWPKTATPASSAPRPTGTSWVKPNRVPRPPGSPRRRRRETSPRACGALLAVALRVETAKRQSSELHHEAWCGCRHRDGHESSGGWVHPGYSVARRYWGGRRNRGNVTALSGLLCEYRWRKLKSKWNTLSDNKAEDGKALFFAIRQNCFCSNVSCFSHTVVLYNFVFICIYLPVL